MKLNASIPTQQTVVMGNVISQYIRAQVFATDSDGNPTGSPLAEQDFGSGAPSPLTGILANNVNWPSGVYALVQFSIDTASQEIPGTRKTDTFRISNVTTPAGGASVSLSA